MFSRSRQPLKSFQSARPYLRRLLAGLFCRTRPPVHGRVRHRAQAPLVDNTKLQVRPGYLDNFVSAALHEGHTPLAVPAWPSYGFELNVDFEIRAVSADKRALQVGVDASLGSEDCQKFAPGH